MRAFASASSGAVRTMVSCIFQKCKVVAECTGSLRLFCFQCFLIAFVVDWQPTAATSIANMTG